MIARSTLATGLVALATASPLTGQAAEVSDTLALRLKRLQARSVAAGPPSSVGPSTGQITIEASETNGRAIAIVAFRNGATLELSTPVQKGAKSTDFVSLDGLENNLSAALLWDAVFGTLEALEGAARRDADPGVEVCSAYGMSLGPSRPACTDGNLESFLVAQGRGGEVDEALDLFDRAFYDDALLWGVSFRAKAGYRDFAYFDLAGVSTEADRISASATASAFLFDDNDRWSVSLTGERSYRDAETRARSCTQIEGTEALDTCRELPLEAPLKVDDVVVRIEWRRLGSVVGTSPVVSWRIDEAVLGLDLPLYFVRDGIGRFTGGLRAGWRSDSRRLQLSIFISRPLGLM